MVICAISSCLVLQAISCLSQIVLMRIKEVRRFIFTTPIIFTLAIFFTLPKQMAAVSCIIFAFSYTCSALFTLANMITMISCLALLLIAGSITRIMVYKVRPARNFILMTSLIFIAGAWLILPMEHVAVACLTLAVSYGCSALFTLVSWSHKLHTHRYDTRSTSGDGDLTPGLELMYVE